MQITRYQLLWVSLFSIQFCIASDKGVPTWAFDCKRDDQVKQLEKYVVNMGPPSIEVLPSLLAAIEANRRRYNETGNMNNLSALFLLEGKARSHLVEFGGYPGSLPIGIWSYYLRNLSHRRWQLVHMFSLDKRPEDLFYYLQIPRSELTPDLRDTVTALFPFPRYKLVDVDVGSRIEERLMWDWAAPGALDGKSDKHLDVEVLLKVNEAYRYKDYYWVSWLAHPTPNGAHSALLRIVEPDTSGKEVVVLIE